MPYVTLVRANWFPLTEEKMVSDGKKSNANEQITENLKRVYEEALQEEIPPRFIEMIERLKAEKKANSDAK